MKQRNQLAGLRLILGASLLLAGVAIYSLGVEINERHLFFVSWRWTGIFLLAIFGLITLAVLLGLTWSRAWDPLAQRFDRVILWFNKLGAFNLLLFGLNAAVFAFLVVGPWGIFFKNLPIRIGLFWFSVLFGAVLIKAYRPQTGLANQLIISALLLGFGYRLAVFIPEISTSPFTLAWSEASRYYYASLYVAESIYGHPIQLTPLHPSRYLMQAVPFLIQGLPIWFHRFWQVFLWIGMSVLTVYLLSRRLILAGGLEAYVLDVNWLGQDYRFRIFLFIAWGFLFLFQGPVYYHLLVMPALILAGFSARHPWRNWLLVLLASLWAGISRINWFAMPGMIAAVLYFLEEPMPEWTNTSRLGRYGQYLIKPLGWILLGLVVAFLSQFFFLSWAGIDKKVLISSFTSDLLWYRLFPSPTFRLGIMPAIVIASAPLGWILLKRSKGIHPFRWLGIGAILLILFTGGVIVSTKIGGGSNLHNLDAYLVILLIAGSYAMLGTIQADYSKPGSQQPLPKVLVAALVLIPVIFAIQIGGYNSRPTENETLEVLAKIQTWVEKAVSEGGDVLFISERQLVTFENIPGVSLVDEFEKVYLMEMAMAGNQEYLNDYYSNIDQQRYALIITDPMKDVLKGKEYSFGEENDVWVKRVTRPTLDRYQRRELFKQFGIEVLEPIP